MTDLVALGSGWALFTVLYQAPSLDDLSSTRLLVAAGLAVLCLSSLALGVLARRAGTAPEDDS